LKLKILLAAACLIQTACSPPLSPGEWGNLRYFDEVRGETPMDLLPPATDRFGNVYVLFGNRGRTDTTVWVGHSDGGWSGGCSAHRGSFGIHGFVGRTDERMWYWAGNSLVEVRSNLGSCSEVLSTDPVSGAEMYFEAVVPWVRETPTRSTLITLIKSVNDARPFLTLIDIEEQIYTEVQPFEPSNARDVTVVATGANPDRFEAYIVVTYTLNNETVSEVMVVDGFGDIIDRIELQGDPSLSEWAVVGFLQGADNGLVAGILESGELIIFNGAGGGVTSVNSFDAIGIHKEDGMLYVTGMGGNEPVIAPISSNGAVGNPIIWTSALNAGQALSGSMPIVDERNSPIRNTTWSDVESAISTWPLVTPYPLDDYVTGTTGWLIAGPWYTSVERMTSVAFAPVGYSVR